MATNSDRAIAPSGSVADPTKNRSLQRDLIRIGQVVYGALWPLALKIEDEIGLLGNLRPKFSTLRADKNCLADWAWKIFRDPARVVHLKTLDDVKVQGGFSKSKPVNYNRFKEITTEENLKEWKKKYKMDYDVAKVRSALNEFDAILETLHLTGEGRLEAEHKDDGSRSKRSLWTTFSTPFLTQGSCKNSTRTGVTGGLDVNEEDSILPFTHSSADKTKETIGHSPTGVENHDDFNSAKDAVEPPSDDENVDAKKATEPWSFISN